MGKVYVFLRLLLFCVLIVMTGSLKGRKLHIDKKDCQVQCQVWCDQTGVAPAQTTTTTVSPPKPHTTTTTTESSTESESEEYSDETRHKRLRRLKINKRLHKKLVHIFKQKYHKSSRKAFLYKDFPSNCKVLCTQPSLPTSNPSGGSENDDNDDNIYVPGEDNPFEITAEPPELFHQYVAPNLFNSEGFDELYDEEPLIIIEEKKKRSNKNHKKHRKGRKI